MFHEATAAGAGVGAAEPFVELVSLSSELTPVELAVALAASTSSSAI
jgi:hypothetical protein